MRRALSGTSSSEVGFGELIRSNASFRWLWIGTIISLLGDWFNTIAIYELVNELTGSPLALGAVFITKMLPFALVSPLAGLIADRFDRRSLMIVSDLLRAGVVLGFLLIDDVGDLPLLYILTALQVAISATFLPARSASIPNITTANELLTANTLMSATWSTMLAIGAALGGFATEWLGIQGVFLVDSASYLVSASFIVMTVIPHQKVEQASGSLIHSAYEDIVDGWRHLVTHPEVGRIAPAKAVWAIGGGALVYMLALLGEEVSPEATAVGIGVLFAARGVGTGIGPVLARAWFTDEEKWPMILGACIVTSGVLYLGVGMLPWTYWVAVCVIIAHAASGANWVLASVLLQKRTEDHFRGRVFGTEWLLLTLADALSILAASLMLESAWIDLRIGFQLFAGIQIVTGILWVIGIVPWEQRENVEVSKRGNVGSSECGKAGTWEGGNAS